MGWKNIDLKEIGRMRDIGFATFTPSIHNSLLSTQEGATDHSKPLFCLINSSFSSQTCDLSFFRYANSVSAPGRQELFYFRPEKSPVSWFSCLQPQQFCPCLSVQQVFKGDSFNTDMSKIRTKENICGFTENIQEQGKFHLQCLRLILEEPHH